MVVKNINPWRVLKNPHQNSLIQMDFKNHSHLNWSQSHLLKCSWILFQTCFRNLYNTQFNCLCKNSYSLMGATSSHFFVDNLCNSVIDCDTWMLQVCFILLSDPRRISSRAVEHKQESAGNFYNCGSDLSRLISMSVCLALSSFCWGVLFFFVAGSETRGM